MKSVFILLLTFGVSVSQALTLIQEEKDILCANSQVKITIDKKDRYIQVQKGKAKTVFQAVEFLDTGILVKSDSGQSGFFQLTPQNTAVWIQGTLSTFQEQNCADTGASKLCDLKNQKLFWSPEKLSLTTATSKIETDIYHYNVHPNDGTYFIGFSSAGQGIGLLDAGSQVRGQL